MVDSGETGFKPQQSDCRIQYLATPHSAYNMHTINNKKSGNPDLTPKHRFLTYIKQYCLVSLPGHIPSPTQLPPGFVHVSGLPTHLYSVLISDLTCDIALTPIMFLLLVQGSVVLLCSPQDILSLDSLLLTWHDSSRVSGLL